MDSYEIRNMLIDLTLRAKSDHEDSRDWQVTDCAHSWPINRHVLNFNDITYFDRVSYKENFVDWILDLEDYFAYATIPKDFKV